MLLQNFEIIHLIRHLDHHMILIADGIVDLRLTLDEVVLIVDEVEVDDDEVVGKNQIFLLEKIPFNNIL